MHPISHQNVNKMKKRVLFIALASALVSTVMAQEVEHRKEVYVIKAGKASGINTATPVEQKEIGKAVMEFMYDYKYLTDTTDVSQTETDRMTLQVTYGMSKFTSFRAMQIDSLIRVSTAEQIRANPDSYIGGETFSIFKNYPQGRFTVIDKVSNARVPCVTSVVDGGRHFILTQFPLPMDRGSLVACRGSSCKSMTRGISMSLPVWA